MTYLDSFLIGLFLLGTLIAGFRHTSRSFIDFAVGDRNFSDFAQIATLVATFMSGSTFFILLFNIYKSGFVYFVVLLGCPFSFMLTSFFLIPRMKNLLKNNSIAEFIGQFYGQKIRILVAILGIVHSIGYVGMQLKAISIGCKYLGLDDFKAILLVGTIVTLYSTTGGIRSVTYTDIIQFVSFTVAIPLLAIMICNNLYEHSIPLSNDRKFDLTEVILFSNPQLWELLPLFIVYAMPLNSVAYQRVLLGSKNIEGLRRNFFTSSVILIILLAVIALIAYFVFSVNSHLFLESDLFDYIISKFAFPGIVALVLIWILSMAMSSADSWINVSSILIVNDLLPKFSTDKKKLLTAKLVSFLIGLAAICFALTQRDFIGLVLLSVGFYNVIATPLIVITILGFRTIQRNASIAITCSGLYALFTFIGNNFVMNTNSILIGIAINILVLIALHYVTTPKGNKEEMGWVGNKDNEYLKELRQQRKENLAKMIHAIKSFNPIKSCASIAPVQASEYTKLAIYLFIMSFGLVFSRLDLLSQNQTLFVLFPVVTSLFCAVLFFYPLVHEITTPSSWLRRLFPVLWVGGIFVLMFYISSIFSVVGQLHLIPISILILNACLACLFIGWKMALCFLAVGFTAALMTCSHYFCLQNLHVNYLHIIYGYICGAFVLLTCFFVAPKENAIRTRESKLSGFHARIRQGIRSLIRENNLLLQANSTLSEDSECFKEKIYAQDIEIENIQKLKNDFLINFQQACRTPIKRGISAANSLYDLYYSLSEEGRQMLTLEVRARGNNLMRFVDNMIALSNLSTPGYKLKLSRISLVDLVKKRTKTCAGLYCYVDDPEVEVVCHIEEYKRFMIECNEEYLTQVIDNIIINAITYSRRDVAKSDIRKGYVIVECTRIDNGVLEFCCSDAGIGIPDEELQEVFKPFVVSSRTPQKPDDGKRGIGLAMSRKVIEAHGGRIWLENAKGSGIICKFQIPPTPEHIKPILKHAFVRGEDCPLFDDSDTEEIKVPMTREEALKRRPHYDLRSWW